MNNKMVTNERVISINLTFDQQYSYTVAKINAR